MKPTVYNNRYFDGVNFDHIIAVKYEENTIEKHLIPINKNEKLIEELLHMVDEDTYEVDDIYYKFRRYYSDYGDFDYCLGFKSLKSYYIAPICYPYFDETNYRKQAQTYKEKIALAKTDATREWRQKDFNKWNYKIKIDYINKCLPYVFACNYHRAIVDYNVEKDYFIFSNETHGRFNYSRKITEDLEIVLKTNFCYGDSSGLYVIITYKGIPILPYSIWVKYFFAGYNEIIRCTRSYSPQRSNWNTCMDFVVWFVEKAVENPEVFVKETIMQEVNGLVNGIEELFKISDIEMKNRLMVSLPEETLIEKYYIGIKTARMANDKDVRYYSIAPEEAKLVFKMEKITGALHFLKSLRQLSECYNGIEQSITKIKEINAAFYPEIVNALNPVKEYIEEMKIKLKPIESRLRIVEKKFDVLHERLQKKLEKLDSDKKDEAKEAFIKKNPSYARLRDEMIDLRSQVYSIEAQISNRSHYLQQLESARSLVRRHVVSVLQQEINNVSSI